MSKQGRNLIVLAAIAVLSFIGTWLLDKHGADWGDPRQAAANILRILFWVSIAVLLVIGLRMLVRRRPGASS